MKQYKTKWDLGLLYKSLDDPKLEADMVKIEETAKIFRDKYYGKVNEFLENEDTFFEAMSDYEKMSEIVDMDYPGYFLMCLTDLDTNNEKAEALEVSFGERYIKVVNSLDFFILDIGKISIEKQKEFLQSEKLSRYRHYLKVVFDTAKYDLSEREEKLVSEFLVPGFEMWVTNTDNLLGKLSITYKGKKVPFHEAVELKKNYITSEDRRMIDKGIAKKIKTISSVAASEMSAIITFGKIEDRMRGMAHPYTGRFVEDEMDEDIALDLINQITSMFWICHRFYELHAKLLGEDKLKMCDVFAPAGEITTKFTFEKSVEIVHKAISAVDPMYGDIFTSYLEKGQIDVFPRKGKAGSGGCASLGSAPVYILFNYLENLYSLGVIGHEIGHGIHAELNSKQPILYQDCSLAVAESASTFFEQATLEYVLELLPEEEKFIAHHSKILNNVYCIFLQAAIFNFELELHRRVSSEGKLSDVEMARLMQKHLASCFGPAVEVTEDDGYYFVYRSHIRDFFYGYTYAYGQLISNGMFEKWKKDKRFAGKIKEFMSAGESDSPYNIFKNIGIDTKDPDFFKSGLMEIDADITRLEALVFPKK